MAQTTFFDCTNCESAQTIVTANEPCTITIKYGENKGQMINTSERVERCSGCQTRIRHNSDDCGTIRRINHTTHKSGKVTECGSACLAGKIVCDCRCQGKCHGASKCQCGVAA